MERVNKVKEGSPHIVDLLTHGDIALVINTPIGKHSLADSYTIRRMALTLNIPYCTTIPGAFAAVQGIRSLHESELEVCSLQEYHQRLRR